MTNCICFFYDGQNKNSLLKNEDKKLKQLSFSMNSV